MGKTLLSIGQAVITLAAVIPGPQQPFAAAAAAGLAVASATIFRSKAERPNQAASAFRPCGPMPDEIAGERFGLSEATP